MEWEFIKAILPNNGRGVKRIDDRHVIDGIFYVLRTGIPWCDLPSECGPYTTVYNRFNRWIYVGIWDRAMDVVANTQKCQHDDDGRHIGCGCTTSAATLKKDNLRRFKGALAGRLPIWTAAS